MGFGDFMSGVQGGLSTMDQLKNSRLKRKLYDQAISEADADFQVRNERRMKGGHRPFSRYSTSDTLIGRLSDKLDPVLARFMESIGRGNSTIDSPITDTLPTAGEMTSIQPPVSDAEIQEPDLSQFDAPVYEFAHGTAGSVEDAMRRADELRLEDEGAIKGRRDYATNSAQEIKDRAARARAVSSAPPRSAIPDVEGDPSKYRPVRKGQVGNEMRRGAARAEARAATQSAIPDTPPKGRVVSGAAKIGNLARGTGAGILAAGSVGAALENALTPDEKLAEYYRRINRPGRENTAGPLEAAGVRAMGVLQDVGRAFIPQSVEDKLFPYFRKAERGPTPEATPQEAIPTSGPPGPRRYPGQRVGRQNRTVASASSAPVAPTKAVPTAPAEASPFEVFDVRKVSAEQVPNFSNKDWINFREEMLSEYMRDGKMSYAEAWDRVDQQVTATQQRGFLHFGNQARALLTVGDMKGAATAVRAAFQYMPTTTDLQVGIYNGHLVAFSVDEDTGEQVGTPIVITPEFLDNALMNFSDRKVWAEYAQDNRRLDLAERELDQGDRRLDLMQRATEIDAFNAETNALRQGASGGSAGMRLTDADRHTQFWQDQAFAGLNEAGIQDPELQDAMAAVMSSLYVEDGGATRPEVIARQVKALARTKDGRARILAAASQLAGG